MEAIQIDDSRQSFVRLACPEDEDAIVDMLRQLHGDCGIRKGNGEPLAFSEDKIRTTIRDAINDGGRSSFLGVVGSDKPEGSVLLQVREQFYTTEKVLSEVWTFVAPQYRQSNNARLLVAFSKSVASCLRMPLVMGIISPERQESKLRFLERQMGSRHVGRYYVFNFDQRSDD